MTLQQASSLVAYHCWARDRILDAVAGLTPEQFTRRIESSFPSVRDTLVHMWAAESVWVARWNGEAPSGFPDGKELKDVSALREAWSVVERKLREVLGRMSDQDVPSPMTYGGFDGKPRTEPFMMMLQHVVNHGSYHRGQVTTMLRQLGAQPAKSMDIITFYRESGPARV